MSVWRKFYRRWRPNPLDSLLKKAQNQGKRSFLICWNRGLGDIPLGLYALVFRIREKIPGASITFLTRPDLKEGFLLLEGVEVIVDSSWKRGEKGAIDPAVVDVAQYDFVMPWPDPTDWLSWQLGTLVPKLSWNSEWDSLSDRFTPDKKSLAVHVETGTQYGYEKNWPLASFRKLLFEVPRDQGIILLGGKSNEEFDGENIVDLRGKTTLLEMLSVLKNHCSHLLVPDSGILSLTYYLDVNFPLRVVSLWADPKQGVLKQNVASPNVDLVHVPIKAPGGDLRQVSPDHVKEALWAH